MEFINPPILGKAIAPYSQGVVVNGVLHAAGQVALDAEGRIVGAGDVETQVHCVLDRLECILGERGATLRDVAWATVYLTDRVLYTGLNRAWSERFGDHRPVRSLVVADLVKPGLLVEIQASATLRE
ncbi:2-iminobutanoate/2-iminopropanoate deaminase [Rhodococcus globerulus]|nr:2-iminobutanoate/2-iminopropanoate deaminase [Rhodococcus globerulus]